MVNKLMIAAVAMALAADFVAAEEIDAVINDGSRTFTKRKQSPEAIVYGKLTLDSKGAVVSTSYQEGLLTKATKVVMGAFDEKRKRWTPGEAIEGGIGADIFQEKGTVAQVRLTVANDKKTISQILVKTTEPLVMADAEFDAILRQVGPQTNGAGAIAYTRLELDAKGAVVKTFPLTTGRVTKDTKVVMGKLNAQEKKWEAGDEVPQGLYGDVFKDLNGKKVHVRITREDRAISQILVCPVGN